mmetsp:Transcript_1224/g.1863  ORF Transcript_1224/g.1863 Transcript_1224/m.1863 type:complete len:97 (-) Transcript_1224:215-505(-)
MGQGQSYDASAKAARDNRSNQLNPNHPAYESSRSGVPFPRRGNDNNRANQLNPNNSAYWQSRGGRPSGDDGVGGAGVMVFVVLVVLFVIFAGAGSR